MGKADKQLLTLLPLSAPCLGAEGQKAADCGDRPGFDSLLSNWNLCGRVNQLLLSFLISKIRKVSTTLGPL